MWGAKNSSANKQLKRRFQACGTAVSWEPVWLSGTAAEGPWFDSASALLCLQKLWSVDTVLFVTLFLRINETVKWLSSLPTLMQESFWWWQCSNRYIIFPLPAPSPLPFPVPYPSLIRLMVSVDVKHHVYLLSPPEWFCIGVDSGVSSFNVSLVVRGKVTKQCPQTRNL